MSRTATYTLMAALLLAAAGAGAWAFAYLVSGRHVPLTPRDLASVEIPSNKTDKAPAPVFNPGTLTPGTGKPSDDPGSWPQFRGPDRTNVAPASERITRGFGASGPEVLWRITLGEGHAGASVLKGRVFVVDYDRAKQEDAIRCLSLADANQELWRYSYTNPVKRNHGMSRTVATVTEDYVVAIGPLGRVTCLRMATGEFVWSTDLVKDWGATIPDWYAGQCPLVDGGRVILAPGGRALFVALDIATGKPVWQTPNPDHRAMTHGSVAVMTVAGRRLYVYSSLTAAVCVDAQSGELLWSLPEWTVKFANVPTPLAVDERVLFTGGYDAGAMMCRVCLAPPRADVLFRHKADVFGAEQQTPILYKDHIYGVIQGGQLACMDLEGKVLWTSGSTHRFMLGPFLIADGLILALNDETGMLYQIEAAPEGYKELAHAKVLKDRNAWAPMALVNGKLILRDSTEMICIRVGTREPQ